jgi:coatomer subunit beta'
VPEQEAESKWKQLGDRALTVWRFDLAKECFEKANDLSALMLLYLAIGDRAGLTKLAKKAEEKGENNLSFATLFQLGDAKACTDLLVKTGRQPEAAMFARTYAPRYVAILTHRIVSHILSHIVRRWRRRRLGNRS